MRISLNDAQSVLARTPQTLRTLLVSLPPGWADSDYGPNTWSAREVMAHLVFNERTDWIPRLELILKHGETKPFDRFDRAGHKDLLAKHTLGTLLDLFARERAGSLSRLCAKTLTPRDLDRRGTHPALGSVTLGNLLAAWVVHDLNHIAQVCKALAYQYKGEVGAWESYLSILSPPNPR